MDDIALSYSGGAYIKFAAMYIMGVSCCCRRRSRSWEVPPAFPYTFVSSYGSSREVWQAIDQNTSEHVCIRLGCTRAEIEATRRMASAGFGPKVLASGEHDGVTWFAQELYDETLEEFQICYEGTPAPSVVRNALLRLLFHPDRGVVSRFHDAGFVHGNLRGSNVVLRISNGLPVDAKLVGFRTLNTGYTQWDANIESIYGTVQVYEKARLHTHFSRFSKL